MKLKKKYVALAILAVLLGFWYSLSLPKKYTYVETKLPDTFEAFYEQRLARSAKLNARPGNEEKLIRYSKITPVAILYIHGYSASRAEGEMVMDTVANRFHTNIYYMRLPGHGTNFEDHANTDFAEYLQDAEETLYMMHKLGNKVIVVGTSMGGLVATYLAAVHPDLVDGLILASPFYDYAGMAGKMLKVPGTLKLVQMIDGPYRNTNWSEKFKKQIKPGYNDYWYPKQKYQALRSLEDLRNYVVRDKFLTKVDAPTLLMYYYKDEKNQDDAASVDAMKRVFEKFKSTKEGKNKIVPIEDANHVMFSEYVYSDKETILQHIIPFVNHILMH